jgi:hypothetical protein
MSSVVLDDLCGLSSVNLGSCSGFFYVVAVKVLASATVIFDAVIRIIYIVRIFPLVIPLYASRFN